MSGRLLAGRLRGMVTFDGTSFCAIWFKNPHHAMAFMLTDVLVPLPYIAQELFDGIFPAWVSR